LPRRKTPKTRHITEKTNTRNRVTVKRTRPTQHKLSAVIVVDLDLTLIDETNKAYPRMEIFLAKLFDSFSHVILWSAGNIEHIKQFIEQYPTVNKFFMKIARLHNNTKHSSYIDSFIKRKNIWPYVLIDDRLINLETGDYDIAVDVKKYYREHIRDNNIYINYELLFTDLMYNIRVWNTNPYPTTNRNYSKISKIKKLALNSDCESDGE